MPDYSELANPLVRDNVSLLALLDIPQPSKGLLDNLEAKATTTLLDLTDSTIDPTRYPMEEENLGE